MRIIVLALFAFMSLLPFKTNAKEPAGITVISYNIRMGAADDGANSWKYRCPGSVLMIDDQKPDIFGLQEALDYQVQYLCENCSDYDCVGVGREDGVHSGEHMSIFYNRKTIDLLKWGTYWLSETPDEPSLGWDAACKRTATWALLKDRRSGEKFYYVNTHLDHIGVEARKEGLALIMNNISEINHDNLPMVITGDFNMTIDHPSMSGIKERMNNARDSAPKTDDHFTYNGWGESSSVIDYIWFSGFSNCPEYETITKPYYERTYISDHYPIKAVLMF